MCYDDNAQPPVPPGDAGAIRSSEVTLTAADGNRFMAYIARPTTTPTAAVLVLPDIRGLHQFYKSLADRFAEVGIAAIAMDYFGRSAGLSARDESFEFWPHVQQLSPNHVYTDAAASLAALQEQVGELPTFSMGFCMGGTWSFLSGTQESLPLTGVIGFYAGLSRAFGEGGTLLDQAERIRRPALGLFGGADQGIPVDQVQEFDQKLDTAGVEHAITIYEGAPHSFFDRRAEEYAEASANAWTRVLEFIASHSTNEVQAA